MQFPQWDAAADRPPLFFCLSLLWLSACFTKRMIMLISSTRVWQKCADLLQHGTGEQVQLVTDMLQAVRCLRDREYTALVLDQVLVDENPSALSDLLQHTGTAILVYLNFTISSPERTLAEVRAAFRRRQAERIAALKVVTSELRDELRGAVTGILLSSELALGVPALPMAAQAKLAEVVILAERMRRMLQV